MTDHEIEQEIQDKGLTAPRVTLAGIEAEITEEAFLHIPNSTITICLMRMKNGYQIVGHSACVSSDNFDEKLGEKIARQHAIDQLWPLFGFQLASEKM